MLLMVGEANKHYQNPRMLVTDVRKVLVFLKDKPYKFYNIGDIATAIFQY